MGNRLGMIYRAVPIYLMVESGDGFRDLVALDRIIV
jgi:hypothetical protein